jgi:type I restriction enzyme S subunit
MSVRVISPQPLVLVIPDQDARSLVTIDAGAAYTAYLHAQAGQFAQEPLGKYVDIVSEHVNPGGKRYADQAFEYIDLGEVDEIFGQILLTRKVPGKEIGSTKHRFRTGDILFARIMPSLANKKVAYVVGDVVNGVASTEFIVLRRKPDADIHPFYLFRAVRADSFTTQAVANVTGATGRQRIAPDTLLTLKIIVPPRDLQARIGAVVEKEFRLRALAAERAIESEEISLGVLGPTTPRTARPKKRRPRKKK